MVNRAATFARLGELPDIYLTLFEEASRHQGFFFRLEWFQLLQRQGFVREVQERIFVVGPENGSSASIILPMMEEPAPASGLASRRLVALANFYSPLFGPLASRSSPVEENDWNLLAWQISSDSSAWDVVTIAPLAKDSLAFQSLRRALERNGMQVQDYFCFGNWYARINGRSFSQYWSELPARMRNTVARRKKKLVASARLQLRVFIAPHDIDEGIACYEQVYAKSWKKPEPSAEFMPALMRMCATHGWARLGVAYIDGAPAAAQFWIVHNKVASIYKLAYDEGYAQYSVGSVLTSCLLEYVIDTDRVEEIDYLMGDDSYKSDWMDQRRERWGLVAFNRRTWKGRLFGAWHVGRRAVKRQADAILQQARRTGR